MGTDLRDILVEKNIRVDIREEKDFLGAFVEKKISSRENIFQDIDIEFADDVVLESKNEIFLERKKQKYVFDALEKKNIPFWKRDIRLAYTPFKNLSLFLKFFHKSRSFFSGSRPYFGKKEFSKEMEYQKGGKKNSFGGKKGRYIGTIFGICIFCSILLLTSKNRVESGYEKLQKITASDISFSEVQKLSNNARFDFLLADICFTPFSILPGEKIDSVSSAISGGRNLTEALDSLFRIYFMTENFLDEKKIQEIHFSQLLANIYPYSLEIEKKLSEALEEYSSISWLPQKISRIELQNSTEKLGQITGIISYINQHYSDFLNMLGHNEKRRYLIVFQNADEIRPTGGFIGSMAFLELYKGKVYLFQKKDVYALEWDLKKANYVREVAPKGIRELTPTFGLRDSNYSPFLDESSEKISYFLAQSDISLDGIIYINQHVIQRLLEITGPIHFPLIEKDINSENFSELFSILVEAKIFKQGTIGSPKQILFDFIEIFQKKILEQGHFLAYLESLILDAKARDIMLWSSYPQENSILSELQLNGNIDFSKKLDFVYPVFTSLSGNKSDRYIQRSFTHEIQKQENCDIFVKHSLRSAHLFSQFKRDELQSLLQEFQIATPGSMQIQGAAKNRQYVRVYIPQGAQVEPQRNIEVFSDKKFTRVDFFLDTFVEGSSDFSFSYTLKNSECREYDFGFYKQAGIPKYNFFFVSDGEVHEYTEFQKDFFYPETPQKTSGTSQ